MLSTSVNRDDYIPYYIQVKNSIQEHIESGGWQIGDQLPGEPELCRMFDVSRTVIRQALKELEIQGLIYREKGRGTFVAEPKIDHRMVQKITGFFQDTVESGLAPVTKILNQELVPASPGIAAHLQIEPGSNVIKVHRLRGVREEFFILDTTYLPYELCPEVLTVDLSSRSLYAFLEEDLRFVIERAHRTIEAVLATEYVAKKLDLNVGDPLILFESVAYLGDGTPIEYFQGYHSSRRTRFTVDLVRFHG
jgi:GntR family transcriptional regulator